jgi:hypothetical protein
MATIAPPKPANTAFPKAQILATITGELIDIATTEAEFRKIKLPPDIPGRMKAAVPMDSLTVVDALCAIESTLGFELRESTVRTGGYNSVQEALDHLMPRIERAWVKKNKGQENGAGDKE